MAEHSYVRDMLFGYMKASEALLMALIETHPDRATLKTLYVQHCEAVTADYLASSVLSDDILERIETYQERFLRRIETPQDPAGSPA